MSIVAKPPLIPPNVNIDNNSTRLMKTKTTEASLSITDGFAIIENGYISNLFDPVNDNEIATKYYVDNFGGSSTPGGPNNSIQINDGLFPAGFIGYPDFTFSGSTMTVDNLTNGTITVGSGRIDGLIDPILPQQAATKNYVDTLANNILTPVNVESVVGVSTQFTAAQFVNTIITRTYLPNVSGGLGCLALDAMPLMSDLIAYLGTNFQVGYSWTTLILMPQNFDQLQTAILTNAEAVFPPVWPPIGYNICPLDFICAIPLPAIAMANYSNILLTSVVQDITPGSELVTAYVVSALTDISQLSQFTDQGILTKNFANLTSDNILIMPITNNPAIVSAASQLYTYPVLQKQLIVRSGLTGITTDNLDSVANMIINDVFSMGGGAFKISIQNISAFNLILGLGAGWSILGTTSLTIPPSYCGNFSLSVNLNTVTGIVRNLGILPLDGP